MKRLSIGATLGGAFCLALACFGTAQAQTVPANDAWANAIAIPSVAAPAPAFSTSLANVNLATTEASDPAITCKNPGFVNPAPAAFSAPEGQMGNSVWFSYTTGADVEYVNIKATEASFTATGFDPVIAVWAGTPATGLHMVSGGCDDDGVPNAANNNFSRIAGLRLQPNTTYYVEVAFNPGTVPTAAMVLKLDMAAATRITVNTSADPTPILLASWPVPPATTGNPCLDPAIVNGCSLRAAVETAAILGEQAPTAVGANGAAVIVPAGTYVLSPWATTPNDANRQQNVGGGDIDVWGGMGIYGAGMGQTIIQPAANGGNATRCVACHSSRAAGSMTYSRNWNTVCDMQANGQSGQWMSGIPESTWSVVRIRDPTMAYLCTEFTVTRRHDRAAPRDAAAASCRRRAPGATGFAPWSPWRVLCA